MNKTEFMEGIHILQNSYNQQFSKEKLRTWWTEFKDIDADSFIKAIEQLKIENKFLPNIAEITGMIINNSKFSSYNLNSSYWYKNLKEVCDRKGTPYYDIRKGVNCLLAPFNKEKTKEE